MSLDLEKAHKALQSLKTEEGQKNLAKLASTIKDVRENIPVDLNDHEFHYVLKTLVDQRTLSSIVKPVAHGFVILEAIKAASRF